MFASTMKKAISILTVILIIFLGYSFLEPGGGGWVAPKSADNIKNPEPKDEVSINNGKTLYKKYCVACHGFKGKGDGIAGASLVPEPADFWKESFQVQSDGAIFWKLSEGKAAMASYKNSISEKDRWDLVNYLRTFTKNK